MRRVVTLLNQVAATLDNNAGIQAQMDGAVKAAKRCQEDNLMLKQASPAQADFEFIYLFFGFLLKWAQIVVWLQSLSIVFDKQALLDEEKVMSAKNQQLRSEIEKLEKQVKAAEEGDQRWSGFGRVRVKWGC